MPWNPHHQHMMGEAARLVRSGRLAEATRAIQQALGRGAPAAAAASTATAGAAAPQGVPMPAPSAGPERPAQAAAPAGPRFRTGMPWRTGGAPQDVEDAVVIDRSGSTPAGSEGCAPERGPALHRGRDQGLQARAAAAPADPEARAAASPAPQRSAAAAHAPRAEAPGSFTRVAFAPSGAPQPLPQHHHYHLYVPPGASAGAPMPLVLMLHGCTQNPVDFAAGTGMNTAAAPAHALVLYPEQPHSANPNGCWNWFRPEDQRRGRGEPALLVAMVRDVMARHCVDPRRVYVAGLSAGGAMAALLAREYPDVFAAVGVHSGLRAGAAHNVMGALSAMKTGAKPDLRGTPVAAPDQAATPVIVFHGDADSTVSARNGEQVVEAAVGAVPGGAAAVHAASQQGRSASGQRYTRTVHRHTATGDAGPVIAEHWLLHGAGHAWAGGHAQGSHTDPRGVDATGEMLRFFLQHPRNLSAG